MDLLTILGLKFLVCDENFEDLEEDYPFPVLRLKYPSYEDCELVPRLRTRGARPPLPIYLPGVVLN
jgi:hypothetical protein